MDNTMVDKFTLMPRNTFAQAVEKHQAFLAANPHERVICDDTITPFAGAMKSLGFKEKLHQSGCSILRQCAFDDCRKSSSTLYLKDNAEYWGCPHCKRISES
ncbi:hypothetical protein [Vibrio owensii]|uniref:hypothetical protein n=1 Tax=Vibrio owensii TaxID=696485 RepID=UPI0018F230AF|nr:hypothetical protein [Vibrio owensii]